MLWFYNLSKRVCWVACKLWFRASSTGAENVPMEGPVVLASSHSSHIDPLLLGIFLPRRAFYVARSSLGKIPMVGLWMRAVGVIFIDRKAPGREAMGRAIEKLKEGEIVAMFPEGTRSRDGRTGEFQRGLLLLLKKSQASVVPVGLPGSFSALPPGKIIPRPRRCAVRYGRVWTAEEVLAPGGLDALRREVAALNESELI